MVCLLWNIIIRTKWQSGIPLAEIGNKIKIKFDKEAEVYRHCVKSERKPKNTFSETVNTKFEI